MKVSQAEDQEVLFTGIDGCRGGWIISTLNSSFQLRIYLIPTLLEAISVVESSGIICIDMPMGLIENCLQERVCDSEIRKELGYPFSSSVFNVPCKQAVYASDFKKANAINKEIVGKGISIQTWNICSKIKELDRFLHQHPRFKGLFKESHPELCFKQLKGNSLTHKKKMDAGIYERISLLQTLKFDVDKEFVDFQSHYPQSKVCKDDVLDSLILAFNAKEIYENKYTMYPSVMVMDANKIQMNVFVGNWV